MLLKDKAVIVTGIGPGFGQHIARRVAEAGASVALASRSSALMEAIAAEIQAGGGKAICVPTDIGSQSQCDKLAANTLAAFGRIDGLVNSAYRPGQLTPLEELDLDDLAQSFDVTLMGALRMVRAVLPAMKRQRSGSIVNIGSQVARKHIVGQGGYAATKAALSCVTRQLALELGGHGIRVNMPVFGWTIGPPVVAYLEAQEKAGGPSVQSFIDGVAANIALKRVPTERDCAQAVVLFLSDLTSEVTGASLDVNGGEYMAL